MNKPTVVIAALCAAAFLTGCASNEQRQANWRAQAEKTCAAYGFAADSSLQQCIYLEMQKLEDRFWRKRRAMGAAMQSLGNYCRGGKVVGPSKIYVPNC